MQAVVPGPQAGGHDQDWRGGLGLLQLSLLLFMPCIEFTTLIRIIMFSFPLKPLCVPFLEKNRFY